MKLRHYQLDAVNNTVDYIKNKKGNPLIVLPTGSGKTPVIAGLIDKLMSDLGYKSILVLTHVKEIIEQNEKTIRKITHRDVGVFSAGLGRKEIRDVTVGGVQSVFRNIRQFKDFEIIIVDEAHKIPPDKDTMYQKAFAGIGEHRLIGLTATDFRFGLGYIHGPGETFDVVTCNWSGTENYNRLIDEGFLCPLTMKRTELEMDTKGIKLIGGDFSERDLSDKFDRIPITNAIIREVLAAGKYRKKWLIFAIDIDHSEHIAEVLMKNGIKASIVHSKMSKYGLDRDKIIDSFKNGDLQCIVNVNVLTTGFDAPNIDMIAMLRPTNSPNIHVQCLGRGARVSEGKDNCLVLDFAGNTERLGLIHDPVVRIKGAGAGGEAPAKSCPDCAEIVAISVRFCPVCKHEFKFEHKLKVEEVIVENIDDGRHHWLDVDMVEYAKKPGFGSPSTLKVTYHCKGVRRGITEVICVEHRGWAKDKADHWVRYRGGERCDKVDDLLLQVNDLMKPNRICVRKRGKFFDVTDSKFNNSRV